MRRKSGKRNRKEKYLRDKIINCGNKSDEKEN